MPESASTAIAEAACWRIAITLLIRAPEATAKVSESWKLIPQSAWPDAIRASGASEL